MPTNHRARAAGYAWALKQAPTTPLTASMIEAAYCKWAHLDPDQFASEVAFAPAPPALTAWRIGVADAAASDHEPRLLPAADGCLSVRQIAQAHAVDRSYLTREVRDGRLPAHRVGDDWRIAVTDYAAWRDAPGRGQWKKRHHRT
jgi:excisionase family DNA binding protein